MSICSIFVLCLTGVIVLFSRIFDSEIVVEEGEADGACVMLPQAWGDCALMVSVRLEAFFK